MCPDSLLSIHILTCVVLILGKKHGKIVGGITAAKGQFPYQVSLQKSGRHFCGASVIAPNKVLTAAQCVFGSINPIEAVAGITQLSDPLGQRILVKSYKYHENYDGYSREYNLAILTLKNSFNYSNLLSPLKLATKNPNPGQRLVFSGWGESIYPVTTNDLLGLEVFNYDITLCRRLLGDTYEIGPDQLCTISAINSGVCNGDMGGAVSDGLGNQVGIAWEEITCARGVPDVFTSVTYYHDWLTANLG